jgi:Xaa-Pro aminopeptidase
MAEGAGKMADKTFELGMLMRRKSARELAAMREACATLGAAVTAMGEAQQSGAHATDVILAGEHAAHRRGAQDVRTLFSLDGGRTLRPFDTGVARAVDPLQVYVAVRHLGYWAEGFVVATASPSSCLRGAGDVLRYAIEMIEPGRRCGDVGRGITEVIEHLRPHPVTTKTQGNSIGLALEEHPLIAAECDDAFEAGGVYSLRVGLCDERDSAIVSAMVAVHEHGREVLWSSPEGTA